MPAKSKEHLEVPAAFKRNKFGVALTVAAAAALTVGFNHLGWTIPIGGLLPKADTTAVPIVSAESLWSQYHANEIAADARYNGKRLAVVGWVQEIAAGPFGNAMIVRLETGSDFSPVQATLLESEREKAAGLRKGEKVGLICIGRGMSLGAPMVDGCQIPDLSRVR